MLGSMWRTWQRSREEAALRRRAIPDDLWKRTLMRFPFLRWRSPEEQLELRRLTSLFLDRKEFSAAGDLRLSNAIVVSIAAQAVLPVLKLGLARYDGFIGIVVQRTSSLRADPEDPTPMARMLLFVRVSEVARRDSAEVQ